MGSRIYTFTVNNYLNIKELLFSEFFDLVLVIRFNLSHFFGQMFDSWLWISVRHSSSKFLGCAQRLLCQCRKSVFFFFECMISRNVPSGVIISWVSALWNFIGFVFYNRVVVQTYSDLNWLDSEISIRYVQKFSLVVLLCVWILGNVHTRVPLLLHHPVSS